MSNLDIFNLDTQDFVNKPKGEGTDSGFYKPYPENGKDGIYESIIRFLPNHADVAKSKIQKYYVYLDDPITGDSFPVDCPSTVGKKSILKDIFWKLKNSHSAADQDIAKKFARKEDYYSLIQIVEDKNKPELEGQIMIFKYGKKINDMLEAQIKPTSTYAKSCNPFDLFSGKLFNLHTRKVGEWNNYDMCSFVGDSCPIIIDGKMMEKTQEGQNAILEYLKIGPDNLTSFEYKDWDDALTERVLKIIQATVPDGRMVNDVIGSVNTAAVIPPVQAPPVQAPPIENSVNKMHEEANATKIGKTPETPIAPPVSTGNAASSLDDLYKDL